MLVLPMSAPRSIPSAKVFALSTFALAVAAVPAAGTYLGERIEDAIDGQHADAAAQRDLRGVWSMHPRGTLGDPVRFYYFHGDGHGLYRYGRVGLNNTHSFDYRIEDGAIHLRFRKTGESHAIAYRVEADPQEPGREWLVLDGDPRARQSGRYFRDGGPQEVQADQHTAAADAATPAGRMWIDAARYATGGMGFRLYQFREPGIDGRGHGWFHQGDFDEWSTEAMEYSLADTRLRMHFSLRDETVTSRFELRQDDDRRLMELDVDPRDFWQHHTFVDMGPSFAGWGPVPASLGRGLALTRPPLDSSGNSEM